MKKPAFISTLALLLLLLNMSCEQANGEMPKFESNEQGKVPAFNKELIINIKGDSIAAYAFIANGDSLKETIILVAGFPGNDNNFDIAQALRRNGKNVIHFNHRGAWGSQGTYTYSNCLEDVQQLISFLSQKEVAKDLKINPERFVLLGRSYGGGIALLAGSKIDKVNKIIGLSSVNYGALMMKYSTLDDLTGFEEYMKKQIMINTNIDDFLQELLDQKVAFNPLSYKDLLKHKKVLLIEDNDKNETWIKELENVDYLLLESDHNFIDKRIELADLIIDWINQN